MPIVIAGCGRSGTSFLRTLLDAHPDIFIPSESLFIIDYLRRAPAVPRWLWRRLLAREPQLLCWYDCAIPKRETVAQTLAAIHQSAAATAGARIWGQKTPRFVRHPRLLEQAFPGIRWILVHRDPRAVVASMKKSGQHPCCVPLAVARWRRDTARLLAMVADRPASVRVVFYERLVADLEGELASIYRGHIRVPPITADEAIERGRPVFFARSRFPINTVREGLKPDPAAVDRWSEELSAREVAYIESHCAREMHQLGYGLSSSGMTVSWTDRLLLWSVLARDSVIPLRYLWYWPEYPVYVVVRKTMLLGARLLNRGARSPDPV